MVIPIGRELLEVYVLFYKGCFALEKITNSAEMVFYLLPVFY